jgi:hypothetical protein
VSRIVKPALAAVAAVVVVLTPLLFLEGPHRTGGFRAAVLLLAAGTLRAISGATADANPAPPDSPFAPARRTEARWRRATPARRSPADALLIGSIDREGQFHHRLRPALRGIADERLRARHGIGIDEAGAGQLLGPAAWAVLRPDRPAPEDRRAPGPDEATMDRVLAAIEGL